MSQAHESCFSRLLPITVPSLGSTPIPQLGCTDYPTMSALRKAPCASRWPSLSQPLKGREFASGTRSLSGELGACPSVLKELELTSRTVELDLSG